MSSREWVYFPDGSCVHQSVEALFPTMDLRWFTDYDGERLLQQKFLTASGSPVWKNIPDAVGSEGYDE